MKKKYQKIGKTFVSIAIMLVSISSCKKDSPPPSSELPSITTAAALNIEYSSATLGGTVTDQGASTVTSRGIAINTTHNPTVDAFGFEFGSGVGSFTNILTGLDPNTTYYVRAYATNGTGTAYGNEISFKTKTGCNRVDVNNNITTQTTWVNGNVYVINGDIIVSSVLTIEPGVVVKFLNDGESRILIQNAGAIVANGTSTERIVFTSLADDSKCGDTNNDGTATQPKKGDWTEINITGSSSKFTYCDFFYGGADYWTGAVLEFTQTGTTATIDHCLFAHNHETSKPNTYAIAGYGMTVGCVITNNIFYDNDRPIKVPPFFNIDDSNVFHNPDNPSEINKRNAIWVSGCSVGINSTVNIVETEVPTVLDICDMQVIPGGTLNIANNVIVKVAADVRIFYDNVSKVVFGSGSLITSLKDDAHGGDSNGDGTTTSPADGDWEGAQNVTSGLWQSANTMYDSH